MIAIAAMTPSRVIGANGKLPWHLPEDLRFFKRTTIDHIIIMGRKTYDSIGHPLPHRENWVLTTGPAIPRVRTLRSPDEITDPGDGRRLYVIGGAGIYSLLLPRCDELLLTRVHREYPGDTFFPEFERDFVRADKLLASEEMDIERYVRSG